MSTSNCKSSRRPFALDLQAHFQQDNFIFGPLLKNAAKMLL